MVSTESNYVNILDEINISKRSFIKVFNEYVSAIKNEAAVSGYLDLCHLCRLKNLLRSKTIYGIQLQPNAYCQPLMLRY